MRGLDDFAEGGKEGRKEERLRVWLKYWKGLGSFCVVSLSLFVAEDSWKFLVTFNPGLNVFLTHPTRRFSTSSPIIFAQLSPTLLVT